MPDTCFDPGDLIIPAHDPNAKTILLAVELHPGQARMLDHILSCGHFPFRENAQILRWAVCWAIHALLAALPNSYGLIEAKMNILQDENFERPTFKLWLATNHRSSIRGTDDAIWRRIRLIPFTQQFSGRSRDPRLPDTLKGELSGILAWAVRGCLEWQRMGLGSSPVVETATLVYRRESDLVGRFIKEKCVDGPKEQVAGKELYQAYVDFCIANGEKPESKQYLRQGFGRARHCQKTFASRDGLQGYRTGASG